MQVFNGLTCTIYDIFRYAFIKLFCWKDEIKDITPTELQDDTSFDQILRTEQKTFDKNEFNHQKLIPSVRLRNIDIQN
ncbi:unnamed protein product [Rotaria sordida]|nr:unnamed protein product [Rotaria sordida]CAF4045884.1 unnamed protein product [Rotaria sordida]CAF4176875.1 unnamed protein product [Rotaria sordida]